MTDSPTEDPSADDSLTDLEAAKAPPITSAGRVVVGVDGSPLSLEALELAADVAKWRGWALHVVHAFHVAYPSWPVPGSVGVPADFESTVAATALEALRAEEEAVLGTDHGLEILHSVIEGQASHVLVEVSEHADLLVVGSRGAGGMRSVLLGSVGTSIVNHAHCNVLVVRPSPPER